MARRVRRRRRLLPRLNLAAVDELIKLRQAQHGGSRGAPPIVGGIRVGAAVNKSCILMLSALLQGYVEDVFVQVSRRKFKTTLKTDDDLKIYRRTLFRWGNPSSENVTSLFRRLGIIDVFDGLSWQKMTATNIKSKLDKINELRNKIAHGQPLLQAWGKMALAVGKAACFTRLAPLGSTISRTGI
jgi:hypothetical protein